METLYKNKKLSTKVQRNCLLVFVIASCLLLLTCCISELEATAEPAPSIDQSTRSGLKRPILIDIYENGGWSDDGGMQGFYVEYGTVYALPECTLSRNGMHFTGWSVLKVGYDMTILQPGDYLTITEDLYLEAMWEYDEKPDTPVMTLLSNMGDLFFFNGERLSCSGPFAIEEAAEVSLFAVRLDHTPIIAVEAEGIELPDTGSWDWFYEGEEGLQFNMPDHDVTITVIYHYPEYAASFDANGGSGEMAPISLRSNWFTFPECSFTPPDGKVFSAWKIPWHVGKEDTFEPGVSLPYDEIHYGEFIVTALWEDDPNAPHKHSLIKVEGVAATCEAAGFESYWRCSKCDKIFADAEANEEITAPKGIAALGHDWGEWVVTKESTATVEGERTRICKRDASHIEIAGIPIIGGDSNYSPKPNEPVPDEYAPTSYLFTAGESAAWMEGNDEGLTFIVMRMEGEDAAYAHFQGVKVDGVSVPPLGYTAREGSLVLTLLPAYLETLGQGGHDIAILFDDGAATVSFTVTEPGSATPVPGPTLKEGELPTWVWVLIGVAGAAAIGFAVFVYAKRGGHTGGTKTRTLQAPTVRRR